jgi:hypothetical protein
MLVVLILGWAFLQRQSSEVLQPSVPVTRSPQPTEPSAPLEYLLKTGDQWLTPDQVFRLLSRLPSQPGDRHTPAEAEQLIQALHIRGAKILIEHPSNRHTPYGGLWDPQYSLIKLTADQLWGIDPLVQTLAHESIHVAQSCQQGGLRHDAKPLGLAVLREKIALVENSPLLYKDSGNPRIEAEAYTYGADPAQALRILEEYCPPTKAQGDQRGS